MRSGPKPKLTYHQRREALARREAGESCAEIGRSYNVSHSTISRLRAGRRRSPCRTHRWAACDGY
ncbi:helix-turn-helix domain-containing protein [Methylobacterium sp. E-041]|uniref:helix-turn-helix domain-containing protein n=1 Tax=Methylobacterium sp. E-041 TaxID=2836573 RepID=UPI001FBBBB13|nr:helix-turn-helix domain-containing protein [Methylobacterium sp. E-041]MCJ2103819.1 helix-turn-helix domain-containing protein [Methylobacterium sp. E-041]